jgi:hypothetical protein
MPKSFALAMALPLAIATMSATGRWRTFSEQSYQRVVHRRAARRTLARRNLANLSFCGSRSAGDLTMRAIIGVLILTVGLAGGAARAQSDEAQQEHQRQHWEEQQARQRAQRDAAGGKWRVMAAEARKRADQATTPELKAKWLQQARGLEVLAEHAGPPSDRGVGEQ